MHINRKIAKVNLGYNYGNAGFSGEIRIFYADEKTHRKAKKKKPKNWEIEGCSLDIYAAQYSIHKLRKW